MHRFSTGPYSVLAADEPGPAHLDTGWLLRSQLIFGALPGAVPCARLHTRLVLWEWGQGGLADSVELVVSELMTNALRAAAPTSRGWAGSQGILAGPAGGLPAIGFRMASDERQVLVEVWDGNPAPPLQGSGPVSQDSESGRGLLMVQQISRQWGYYYPAAEPARPASASRRSRWSGRWSPPSAERSASRGPPGATPDGQSGWQQRHLAGRAVGQPAGQHLDRPAAHVLGRDGH